MDLTTIISILGLLVAVLAVVVNLASLTEQGWAVIRRWGKRAARALHYLYSTIALVNGSAGTLLFYFSSGMPTRKDVMGLVIFLLNIAIGIWQLHEAAESKPGPTKSADEGSRA